MGRDEPTERVLEGARVDFENAFRLLDLLFGDHEELDERAAELHVQVKGLVMEPETWQAIEAVAEALIEERSFGLKRLEELVRNAASPTV